MSDIPYDRLIEPKSYEDWHEWDCSTYMGPPGPFACDCKLSEGWKVFLLPPETRDCRCSHRRDQHLNDEECTGDNDFCVCVKYVPSSGSSTAQPPLRLASSGEWLIQAGRLAEERLRKIPREMLDPTARRLLDSIDANRSNEQKDDWKYCFHSSGNEPGCAACWHGSFERAVKANQELQARLQFLIDWSDAQGYLEEHCFTFPDGETWNANETKQEEPLLGLATTRQLLEEVAVRMEITQNSIKGRELGILSREALEKLSDGVLNYRTVDSS